MTGTSFIETLGYEPAEVSAAKNVVMDIIQMDVGEDVDAIEVADKIVTALIAGGIVIPENFEDAPYTV